MHDKLATQLGRTTSEQTLLENHLEFLRTHRGSLRATEAGVALDSSKAEFTYLMLGHTAPADLAAALHGHRTVQRLPWSAVDEAALGASGFVAKGRVAYMSSSPALSVAELPAGLDVVRASTVGSSRVDLQACKLEYSIVSPK